MDTLVCAMACSAAAPLTPLQARVQKDIEAVVDANRREGEERLASKEQASRAAHLAEPASLSLNTGARPRDKGPARSRGCARRDHQGAPAVDQPPQPG